MPVLDLSDILSIKVNLPTVTAATANYSLGLILSANTVISVADRVKAYNSVDGMIAAGFTTDSAEVQTATLYFGQSPAPTKVMVGVQAVGETAVAALTACRIANTLWYSFVALSAVAADIEALAAYAEATPNTAQFYTTADAAVLAGTAGNVALTLQGDAYNRSLGTYSTTTANAAAAVMGLACGLNTGDYTAFTLADKTLAGVAPEVLTQDQLDALEAANINVYTTRLGTYKLYELGVMASGADFGDIVGLDLLVNNIQTNIMQLRMSTEKVPETDMGVTQYESAITGPLVEAYDAGFLGAGVWDGKTVGTLTAGTMLPEGYSIQAGTVADLTEAERAAGTSPSVYACIYRAGHIRKFVLDIDVSQ